LSDRCDTSPHAFDEEAMHEAGLPRGILTLCSYCNKIRNAGNYWQRIEYYIAEHSEAEFSHGICPDCFEGVVRPQLHAVKGRALVLS
jgi:phosphoserine phosphatase RsbU/P